MEMVGGALSLDEGMEAWGELVKAVRFADKKTIFISIEGLKWIVDSLIRVTSVLGMKVNLSKPKVIRIARKEQGVLTIRSENQTLEEVRISII